MPQLELVLWGMMVVVLVAGENDIGGREMELLDWSSGGMGY
jgi:hypothetical protein